MRIALFEDQAAAENFSPIALMRPVFELLCGQFSARERAIRFLPVTEWGAFLRTELVDVYQEEHREAAVNDLDWLRAAPTLFLNGRWQADPASLANCDLDAAGIVEDSVAYLTLEPDDVSGLMADTIDVALMRIAKKRRRVAAGGKMALYPWDLVSHNCTQLIADFRSRPFGPSKSDKLDSRVAIVGDSRQTFIDPSANVDPFVVIDTRLGPVTIEAGANIQAFTRLEGPCHIGRGSQLYRANIHQGTSIGPVCRVGGEVEESILHGYVNKHHDGFLGHSYICPWVNLGALTSNSDLKNDYSAVTVPLRGSSIDTGETKIGCFIGDHTKTAIGSLFNTGSSVGIMSLILPDGELLPKHIPSFCRMWHGDLIEGLPVESGLETARIAMERRNVELTDAQQRLMHMIHADTQLERDRAIECSISRRSSLP